MSENYALLPQQREVSQRYTLREAMSPQQSIAAVYNTSRNSVGKRNVPESLHMRSRWYSCSTLLLRLPIRRLYYFHRFIFVDIHASHHSSDIGYTSLCFNHSSDDSLKRYIQSSLPSPNQFHAGQFPTPGPTGTFPCAASHSVAINIYHAREKGRWMNKGISAIRWDRVQYTIQCLVSAHLWTVILPQQRFQVEFIDEILTWCKNGIKDKNLIWEWHVNRH